MVRKRGEGEGFLNRSVAVVHFGGLGDVVRLSEAVMHHRAASPDAGITVYCREAFAPVVAHYAVPADAVVGVPFDPAAESPEATIAAREFFHRLGRQQPSLLSVPEPSSDWLTQVAIATLQPERIVVQGAERGPGVPLLPRLVAHAGARESAREFHEMAGQQLPYLAVFPFADSRVPLKMWPVESYVELISRLRRKLGVGVLLVAGIAESEALFAMRDRLAATGEAECLAGRPENFEAVFARISLARGFVGNDTGLSHAAAALGLPGVTIYGGGSWPSHHPWAPGSVGIVGPLPCFGCAWDCTFGHGVCVERIGVAEVASALVAALDAPEAPPRVISLEPIGAKAWHELEREMLRPLTVPASATFANAGADEPPVPAPDASSREASDDDRAVPPPGEAAEIARLEAELAAALADRDMAERTSALFEAAAAERLAALDMTTAVVVEMQSRAQGLERAGAEEAYELELDRLAARVRELESELASWQERANGFEAIASERLAVLERTNEDARAAQEAARATAAALEARAAEAESAATERLAALERTDVEARAAAEQSRVTIDALQVHLAALEAASEAAERSAAERLEALNRTSEEARIAAERHREERDALEAALHDARTSARGGHDSVAAELEALQARALAAEETAHERLETLERTAEEARLALSGFRAEREDLLRKASARGAATHDVDAMSAELDELRARAIGAELAARERLEALLASSEEMRRVSQEAERRSVLIAELTSLVASQHDQLDTYARRSGKT